MAAWKYVKTPTALADVFMDIYIDEDQTLASYASRLKMAFLNKISGMSSRIDLLENRMKMAFKNKVTSMSSGIDLLETRILGADPRKILARGYALVLDGDGVVMKSAGDRKAGDKVSVMFADGTLECTVEECKK